MRRSGFLPDRLTYHSLILGLCNHGMLELGIKMLKMVTAEGSTIDDVTFNMLIRKCCEINKLDKVIDLTNNMEVYRVTLDADTQKAITDGLIRRMVSQNSFVFMLEMLEKGFIPTFGQYCTLMKGMCRVGNIQGAFELKDKMVALGVSLDDAAECAMVRGLALCGKIEEAMWILRSMLRMQKLPTTSTFTTLMHVLCKKGNFKEAQNLKSLMEHYHVKLDVITYNVLISDYCAKGDVIAALDLYEEMKQKRLWPNMTTYRVLVAAISTEQYVSRGEVLLKDLNDRGLISGYSDGKSQSSCRSFVVVLDKLNSLRFNQGNKAKNKQKYH